MLGWALIERVDQFSRDWPKYRAPLRSVSTEFESRLESLEARVSEIEPGGPGPRVLTVTDPHPVRTALLGRLNSLYAFLFAATFMPFLVFFMLAAKRQVWHATMQLFPATERTEVKEALADVTHVLRSYLMGTALVGMILVLASWLFFMALGLDFPFLTGLVSGLCNLVPYLGAVMSWIPPLLIGLKQYHGLAPYLGIFAVLTVFHMVTANLLIPAHGRLARPAQRVGAYCFVAVLGLAVGRDGIDPCHSHHCSFQGDLRPRPAPAACGPLAQRLACWLLSHRRNRASFCSLQEVRHLTSSFVRSFTTVSSRARSQFLVIGVEGSAFCFEFSARAHEAVTHTWGT